MGGHLHRCHACGVEIPLYNSCGDRHCPKCQGGARAAWLAERAGELLPVQYFHVVFSVPHELTPLAAAHPARFYTLLFRAVRETLLEIAATPRHLGAQIGGLMVLHTWGQTLELHPHVHVIVPGGGLAPDGTRWISCSGPRNLPLWPRTVYRQRSLLLVAMVHSAAPIAGREYWNWSRAPCGPGCRTWWPAPTSRVCSTARDASRVDSPIRFW